MSSCSKAPRGLFVLVQVGRIFTAIAISPSPSSRQLPSRSAFCAGRNLPDKEFRYLRTVIVTAAVYPGLHRKLTPHLFQRKDSDTRTIQDHMSTYSLHSIRTPTTFTRKGRSSYIAEFLKEGSSARLSTLIPVHLCRFRYGFDKNITTRKFLGS